jgi:hypothetical protein
MITRIVIIAMVVTSLIAGAALYYLQVYAYYREVLAADAGNVQMTSLTTGQPEEILFENFKAIDSDSSPIRFRACFDTPLSQAMLTETYETYPAAEPLIAPDWFDCFDAEAIGTALESGEAIAFMGVENVRYGVDRVVAVMPDGRGFIWQQINSCGTVVFNGQPAPEGCPPVPESLK